MELRHEFTVPAGIEETWDALNDIESVAECFPGATVTSVEGDSFHGTVKVKLGPIQMVYRGSGTFTEKDEAARRMVIAAKGKDKRGNGTAGADVVATMSEDGSATRVVVGTDLAITGKPAQFGRGVMQDVSDKLLEQFIGCLGHKLGAVGAAEPAVASAGAAAPETVRAATEGPGPASEPSLHAVPPPAGTAASPSEAPGRAPSRAAGADDAIDLGATVLPVLLKSYWKQALAVVVVLLVLRRLLRR